MKSFHTFRESIIDIPRSTYAPMVFDKEDTRNPVIKPSVIKMIEDQLAEFEKEYPVLKYTLIGSILTHRYRNDADLDINVLFDVPEDKREDERVRLSKKYLSASNPDNIQGKEIPGTKHPVNYYFITDKETYDSQNAKADAVFDIKNQKFVKRPEDFKFDMNLYLKDFEKKVQEIDVVKGELKRDIIDYDELSELKPGEIKDLEKRLTSKLNEIEKSIQDLSNIGDVVDAERRAAFDKDMTPDEIKTFSIKNRLPKNVIYKMLEKYHYLTFLKKCKKILDDGEVTDAEIDTLRKEEKVQEALDKTSKLVFAFGRFNPPTIGHDKLMREVISQARKNGANHIVYASASTDKRKNPLDQNTKIKFMKKMFPKNKIAGAGGNQRTFMEVLKFYDKMYGEIIMIAGSDRINEFQKLADKYNGKDYNYKSIKVVSSGDRDPDAEGVTGMSASKMREMAKQNDFKTFKTGLTRNLSDRDAKQLFDAVKKGMGLKERYESFTDFLNNDLREEYYQEKIFNVGDMIEHVDGSTGTVVRRGTNYVSYENDGLVKKAWLYDIQPLDEDSAMLRFRDLLPKKMKHALYRMSHAEKYKKALQMYRDLKKDKDVIKRGLSDKKIREIAAQAYRLSSKEFEAVFNRKTRYEDNLLDSLEKEMGSNDDEYFDLNQVAVKVATEVYEIGQDYAQHTMKMTPHQPVLSFKLANKVIERKDIDNFANEDKIIDKYKKRYGDRWEDELEKAVIRMKKEL